MMLDHLVPPASLRGLRVAAIVTDGFEQVELKGPRSLLERAGATVELLAPVPWVVQGYNHARRALLVPIDLSLRFADATDYDALLLPGGPLSTQELQWEPAALELIRAMNARGCLIGAVDDAPRLFVTAGVMPGRLVASHPRLEPIVRLARGRWADAPVVRDRNWLTARGPRALRAFTARFIALLAEQRRRAHAVPTAA